MRSYISVSDAIDMNGLRLVLSPGFPGPWSEAAKAVLDLKKIDYASVAQKVGGKDEALRNWTGQESAPAAMFEGERPRTRWYEILLLAERLAPEPRLIPTDERDRAWMFGLLYELCGEDGLGWTARHFLMHLSAPSADQNEEGEPADPISVMIKRYEDRDKSGEHAVSRMRAILGVLADQLRDNQPNRCFIGDRITALDIYWAAFSNLLVSAAPEICPMPDSYRQMSAALQQVVGDVITPALLHHRDYVFEECFSLPMSF